MNALPNWCTPERLPPLQGNPTTKRYSRTLEEAFGAGTGREIESEPLGWRFCDVVCIAGVLIVLALLAIGRL